MLLRSAPVVPSGGDIAPARLLRDAYPTFNGIAIDTERDFVVASDTNLKSVLMYTPRARSSKPLRQIRGEKTEIGFVAGVAVDPEAREIYAVNNDIEDSLNVFSYDSAGNVTPARRLSVPHQSWGIALSPARDEFAVSVEVLNAIMIYRRIANIVESPRRVIRGSQTEIADPHGVFWDGVHGEIVVANHGNFRGLAKNTGSGCMAGTGESREGQFRPPSINIYPESADGDVKPLRKIEGLHTGLDFPMGVAVDAMHDEIIVANNGDSSLLIFDRSSNGDVAPRRVIRGPRTGIDRPMGVAIDPKNDGFWAANFGNHTATFFSRTASGDAAPIHVIRNAPPGTPTVGFGNPMALAFDSRRKEILVPN